MGARTAGELDSLRHVWRLTRETSAALGGVMARSIRLDELQKLITEGVQLVEVLPEAEYLEAHLPGAVNIPLKELTPERVTGLDRERPIVVYCWDSL